MNVISSHILQNTDSDDQKNAEYQPNVSQLIVKVHTRVNMYDILDWLDFRFFGIKSLAENLLL